MKTELELKEAHVSFSEFDNGKRFLIAYCDEKEETLYLNVNETILLRDFLNQLELGT